MGIDLMSHEDGLSFSFEGWSTLLSAAEFYGWEPAGTVLGAAPEHQDIPEGTWNGNYGSNDFQTVTAEDAKALATAVEKALTGFLDGLQELGITEDRVRCFIIYCRAGEFVIA